MPSPRRLDLQIQRSTRSPKAFHGSISHKNKQGTGESLYQHPPPPTSKNRNRNGPTHTPTHTTCLFGNNTCSPRGSLVEQQVQRQPVPPPSPCTRSPPAGPSPCTRSPPPAGPGPGQPHPEGAAHSSQWRAPLEQGPGQGWGLKFPIFQAEPWAAAGGLRGGVGPDPAGREGQGSGPVSEGESQPQTAGGGRARLLGTEQAQTPAEGAEGQGEAVPAAVRLPGLAWGPAPCIALQGSVGSA